MASYFELDPINFFFLVIKEKKLNNLPLLNCTAPHKTKSNNSHFNLEKYFSKEVWQSLKTKKSNFFQVLALPTLTKLSKNLTILEPIMKQQKVKLFQVLAKPTLTKLALPILEPSCYCYGMQKGVYLALLCTYKRPNIPHTLKPHKKILHIPPFIPLHLRMHILNQYLIQVLAKPTLTKLAKPILDNYITNQKKELSSFYLRAPRVLCKRPLKRPKASSKTSVVGAPLLRGQGLLLCTLTKGQSPFSISPQKPSVGFANTYKIGFKVLAKPTLTKLAKPILDNIRKSFNKNTSFSLTKMSKLPFTILINYLNRLNKHFLKNFYGPQEGKMPSSKWGSMGLCPIPRANALGMGQSPHMYAWASCIEPFKCMLSIHLECSMQEAQAWPLVWGKAPCCPIWPFCPL